MDLLSENAMWQAVVNCDERFDGLFFYAVKTTGIVCRPSCRSKVPRRENIRFYNTLAEATDAGFRTCKRCRPDLNGENRPDKEIIFRTCQQLREDTDNAFAVRKTAARVGLSEFHLRRLFRRATGVTPAQFQRRARVEKARELLRSEGLGIVDVAFAAGFCSLSSFYTSFRRLTGLSPGEYRDTLTMGD